jgi:hypothetical protein
MHDGEQAYYITDTSLAALAEALSLTSPPLLTLDLGPEAGADGLKGTVALTDTGRAVLTGRQDKVALCGIDRWFGGVHLQGRGPTWRWDPALHRITTA